MKIGVISLGLIGGSIFKALIAKGFDVVAVTRNQDTISSAKIYTQNVSDDITTMQHCDIIFVCSPMNKTLEILDKLDTIVDKDTIVADVCSLKKFVMEKKRPYMFIGSHPMAGTENNGFEFSFDELFQGAKWVITPSCDVSDNAVEKLKDIIINLGAIPILADANEHDKAVALISHMPLIVAQALIQVTQDNNLALSLASSGFRDMTRLALSNTEMANDMYTLNNKNIKDCIQNLKENINVLMDSDYAILAKNIKDIRQNLYNKEGKNIYN